MQFLDNRVRFLHPNFLIYMGDPATILNFLKIILVFSKVMAWLYKYSMPYFQFCTV